MSFHYLLEEIKVKFFKKTDIIIVSVIILVGIIIWLVYNNTLSKNSVKAEIYYKSQLVETVDLSKGVDKTFSIPQDPQVVFHIDKEGNICFETSDCPDKICVKTGKLNKAGETAACLPNEIILKIVPSKERSSDDLDMIVGK